MYVLDQRPKYMTASTEQSCTLYWLRGIGKETVVCWGVNFFFNLNQMQPFVLMIYIYIYIYIAIIRTNSYLYIYIYIDIIRTKS
jgi:hypothetical protein